MSGPHFLIGGDLTDDRNDKGIGNRMDLCKSRQLVAVTATGNPGINQHQCSAAKRKQQVCRKECTAPQLVKVAFQTAKILSHISAHPSQKDGSRPRSSEPTKSGQSERPEQQRPHPAKRNHFLTGDHWGAFQKTDKLPVPELHMGPERTSFFLRLSLKVASSLPRTKSEPENIPSSW